MLKSKQSAPFALKMECYMLKFFLDTNSELWYEIVDKMDCEVINMPYCLDGELFQADLGRNKDYIKFFESVKNGAVPTTCGLNEQDYIDYFEPHLSNGDDIVYVTFSHKLSNTFEYMKKAIEQLKKKYPERTISYVDTKQISVGNSLVVIKAYEQYKLGASAEEIVKFVENFREEVCTCFGVDDLMHLKRGGRVSPTTAVIGTLLGVKPILMLDSTGSIVKCSTARKMSGVVKALFEYVKNIGENVADYPVIIAHAMQEKYANDLKNMLADYLGVDADIRVQYVGPTIGTHCGVGTIGISFHKKAGKF